MSINVNNLNKADLVKLALQKKGKTADQSQKPQWMLPTGSIFVAGNTKIASDNKTATPNLTEMNTKQSVFKKFSDNNGLSAHASGAVGKKDEKSETDEIKNIDNASDGKKAAKEADSQQKDVKAKTAETEKDAKEVNKDNKDAVKLDKKMKKDQKSFELKMKKNEKLVTENNLKIQKSAEAIDDAQNEITTLQSELDGLLASQGGDTGSWSSLSLAGDEGIQDPRSIYARKGAAGGNDSRIQELQTQIGAKSAIMDSHGKQIYTLQRSSTRTIKSMQTMSNVQVRTNKMNQKALQADETNAQKVIKVADKIDQISGAVAQVGTTLNYAGKGLVALGASMTWAAGAGAALIAAGQVMEKVGTVTELVGNYGQMAANITKTAAYAADGNLMGAISSAGAAMMSGASAVKGTKELGKNMEAINKQAQGATEKLAAGVAAKDTVKQQTAGLSKDAAKEQLGGMSKKEARKSIQADLQQQMADGKISGSNVKELVKNSEKMNVSNVAMENGKISSKFGSAATDALDRSKGAFSEAGKTAEANLKKNGKKITKKSLARATSNEFKNNIAGTTAKETAKAAKGKTTDTMMKIGQSLQTAAAGFNQQSQQVGSSKKPKARDPIINPRVNNIIAINNRRRASVGRMFA